MRSRVILYVGLGRRVLEKLKMDAEYEGNVEAIGEDVEYEGNVEAMGEDVDYEGNIEATREDYSVKSVDIMVEIIGRLSSLILVILL